MNFILNIINYTGLILIFIILTISPVPYGSVEEWAKLLLQLECFLLLLLLSFYFFLSKETVNIHNNKVFYCIVGFFVLLVFQIVPLPLSVLKIISNSSYSIWSTNQELFNRIGILQDNNYFTISLYPFATLKEILLLLAYFSFGISVAFFCNNKNRIKFLIYLVFLITFTEACIGVYQSIYLGELSTGTYINRNHFSGFIELTIFLLIGFSLGQRDYSYKFDGQDRKSYIKDLLSSDSVFKQITLILVISFIGIALFTSQSRMAIFSFLATSILMYILINRYSKNSPAEKILVGFGIFMTLCFVFFISFYPLLRRFVETIGEAPSRTLIWKDSLRIFLEFPVFGTGIDTFRDIYPHYKSLEIASRINFAHNDYIQLLVETGIIGFVFLMTALFFLIKLSLQKITFYFNQKDYFAAYIRLGALCGIISILIHSLVDFNLHIPANAIYFALLIGIIFSGFDGRDDSELNLVVRKEL